MKHLFIIVLMGITISSQTMNFLFLKDRYYLLKSYKIDGKENIPKGKIQIKFVDDGDIELICNGYVLRGLYKNNQKKKEFKYLIIPIDVKLGTFYKDLNTSVINSKHNYALRIHNDSLLKRIDKEGHPELSDELYLIIKGISKSHLKYQEIDSSINISNKDNNVFIFNKP